MLLSCGMEYVKNHMPRNLYEMWLVCNVTLDNCIISSKNVIWLSRWNLIVFDIFNILVLNLVLHGSFVYCVLGETAVLCFCLRFFQLKPVVQSVMMEILHSNYCNGIALDDWWTGKINWFSSYRDIKLATRSWGCLWLSVYA